MQHSNKKSGASQKLLLTALATIYFGTAPLYAADWTEFRGKAQEATLVFVDERSLVIERDTVVGGWVKFEYTKPKYQNGQEIVSRVTHRLANCETGRYWVTEDMLNVKNGLNPIPLPISSTHQEWQKITPSSDAEMAFDALCYQTKSMFGNAWDTVKESYHSPAIGHVDDMSDNQLAGLLLKRTPGDKMFRAWAGTASMDARKVDQSSNHILISDQLIHFIGWNKDIKQFHETTTLPLADITGITLVRGGNYEQLKQLQLDTATGKTVVSFSVGEDKLAEDVYAMLVKKGLRNYSSTNYVHGYRLTKP